MRAQSMSLTCCGGVLLLMACDQDDLFLIDPDGGISLPAAAECSPGTSRLTRALPSVMLVVDRSGSMATLLDDQVTSRWGALTSTMEATLPQVDQQMETGALFFPIGAAALGCTVPSTADLTPGVGNANAVLNTMRTTSPAGATPTADAMVVAANTLAGADSSGRTHALVLATDGAPSCNEGLNPSTCVCMDPDGCTSGYQCLDDERTIGRIAQLSKDGLPTYVIGISDGGDAIYAAVLERMAQAGGRARPGAARGYYAATSTAEMTQALLDIQQRIGSCVWLFPTVPAPDATITVRMDGTPVPYDSTGTNGWSWGDRSRGELVLGGQACDEAVALGQPQLDAAVECAVMEDAVVLQ